MKYSKPSIAIHCMLNIFLFIHDMLIRHHHFLNDLMVINIIITISIIIFMIIVHDYSVL